MTIAMGKGGELGPFGAAGLVALGAVVILAAASPASSAVRVFCDIRTGEPVVAEDGSDSGVVMSEALPGGRTAEIWIDENCPARQCDSTGRCVEEGPFIDPEGWYVLCHTSTGHIGVVRGALPSGFSPMSGPHAGRGEADAWVERRCPEWTCDSTGGCADPPPTEPVPVVETVSRPEAASAGGGSLRVLEVMPGSAAEAAGFAPGDELQMLDGVRLRDEPHLQAELSTKPAGSWVIFFVERDRQVSNIGFRYRGGTLGLLMERESSASARSSGATAGWTAGAVTSSAPARGPGPTAADNGGWTVGAVTTGAATSAAAGPSEVVGPGASTPDLTPLVDAARVSVAACAYPTALANADQMARFDPSSPWLEANHDRLRQLAERQRRTEQAIWMASSQLDAGKIKDARKTVYDAADMAVACQDEAVAVLLHRIDEVLTHRRAQRRAANARLAGELLAGLFVVNQAVTAHYGGGPTPTGDPAAALVSTAGSGDPCSFNYSYPNVWSTDPVCGCGGYRFDATKLRCVK